MYEYYGLYVSDFDYSSNAGNHQLHVYCIPILFLRVQEGQQVLLGLGNGVNYDVDNVVRGRTVFVSTKLMMKNLVVSELLLIFAAVNRASFFRVGM